MATIREVLSEEETDALRQFDAVEGRYDTEHYTSNMRRNPTSVPSVATRDINSWTTKELDMIAMGVQQRNLWNDGDLAAFRRDLYRQLKSFVSFLDFDTDMDFVAYEEASSLCMSAYHNGRRTAERLAEAQETLAALRRQNDGTEFSDEKLSLQLRRVQGYEERLWYWRERYAASREVYKDTVSCLIEQFSWLRPVWTPPDKQERQRRAAAQRQQITAAQTIADEYLAKARK